MSTPIKPPGSAPIGPPTELGDPVSEANQSTSSSIDNSAAVEKDASVQGGQSADPVSGIMDQLQSGKLDAETAIDQIVSHAMQNGGAQLLAPADRAKLEQFLRDALADDPALAALVKSLET